MQRISHDLPGVAQRLTRISDELLTEVENTQQVWKDSQAQAFVKEHMQEIRPTVQQLVVEITRTVELFEDVAKKLSEPR